MLPEVDALGTIHGSFMRYGFVIDQDRCIGCHACTVACKEEHQVPIGVFRTWVKYVETGEFPQTKRHFGVMRCNHCDDAPCIEICPTHSLFRRSDGIVDFDNRRCIGCKSCMQACPYDALYIDPNSNTAAKCNFCAHRVEQNLEPACVIVCPTQAILAGDMDDISSKTGAVIANRKTSVRKPEKGTQPKLHYVGIHDDLLHPTRLLKQNSLLFAERRDTPMTLGNFDATQTREVYDVPHPAPWGWKIAAYLWTKSIAAGVLLVLASLMFLGTPNARLNIVSPIIALVAVAATLALLIFDLKRPERFFYMLITPNFRSWLVLGGNILVIYGALAAAWLFFGWSGSDAPAVIVWPTIILAIATASYSAFLFAQAKGRDFWRHKWFNAWQLLVQALVAGSAVQWIVTIFQQPTAFAPLLYFTFTLKVSLVLWLINLAMELVLPQRTAEERMARWSLIRGPLSRHFLALVILGILGPLGILVFGNSAALATVATIMALFGLFWFEYVWVRAGQSVPLS
ncbi:MAG TPA: 4Fe-4S dicluster domain-containing protein [Candidatus Angelobacter sp.]|nr:4Fe-4S dicluster domain-containing protein [Candidatus Angelobacter sp.]